MKVFGKRLFVILFLALAASACARQQVMTNTYLAAPSASHTLQPASSFAVLPNMGVANPIFDQTVREKIEFILESMGYLTIPPEQADYFLHYNYDMTEQTAVRRIYYPRSRWRGSFIRGSSLSDPYYYDRWGHTPYMEEPYTIYTGKLRVSVTRNAGSGGAEENNMLWVGESLAETYDPDMRGLINYLLAASFRYFMQDTGKSRSVSLDDDQTVVKSLESISAPAPYAADPGEPAVSPPPSPASA